MSSALTAVGWLSAASAAAAVVAVRRTLDRRMELVARACHELRGPLTAARLGLHGLDCVGGGRAARVAALDGELDRAALALDDLAAARSGERAVGRSAAIEVGSLLRQTAAAWKPVAEACGVDVRVQADLPDAVVKGDRLRLSQACANLVANGIEHGDGIVYLRARATTSHVRIEVSDDGPGLPAPFARLVASPRAGRGRRGRGLAIAAEIAERHGGRLAPAPSVRGARLALELPKMQGISSGEG